ncbi:MAG: cytochrome P450 [Planctomycetota bacterium]
MPLIAPWSGRPSLPFPHPWNYREPIAILEAYFWGADADDPPARHSRYLDVPGFSPVLVTRDPRLIRAIASDTGDKPGQFDRDTMPSVGIARATGHDTLLYANGSAWKHQKRLANPPFGKSSLYQPERFHGFEQTFRATAQDRVDAIRRLGERHDQPVTVRLEQEIKAVMLELLVNNFFGADVSYDEIRQRYVPALERVIDHIVTDTVINRVGLPLRFVPAVSRRIAEVKASQRDFERLTDVVIATRGEGKGLWSQFKSDAPDEALRGNVRVFLAGALEATTSFACWAISHLARHPDMQDRLFAEVHEAVDYSPESMRCARYLGCVLEETLRLTPSLYFMPRRATVDRWVETSDGQRLLIPRGTHVLLDVWHANRHEDHWGVEATGHPADRFVPERWESLDRSALRSQDLLHFGFGHGPRFCPGQHLGMVEVALVVAAFVRLFRFSAVDEDNPVEAGVSTRPKDGTLAELRLRETVPERIDAVNVATDGDPPPGCPMHDPLKR